MQPSIVAGIDVSKRTLDVALLPKGTHQCLAYTADGITALGDVLIKAGAERVVLEATGGLENRVAQALARRGLAVHRVNPERIFGFRKSLGKQAKTDKLDAGVIARFAQVMSLPERPLPSPDQQAVKDLAARRRQLVEMIAAERNRLKQVTEPRVLESIRATIEALSAARASIQRQLDKAISSEPLSRKRSQILRSMPGFGPVVVTTLISELPELGTVDRHAIASLAGVAPHPQQSGTSRNGHRLRSGRPCVRAALYMAALSASRVNPVARAQYQALPARGKAPKQALLAVARKLVTTANQMIRDNTEWQPPNAQTA